MKIVILLISLFIFNSAFSNNTYEYKSIKSISSTEVATCMIEEEKGIVCWNTSDIHKLYYYETFLKKPKMISVGHNNFCAIDREKVDCQVLTKYDIFASNDYLLSVPQGIDKPRSISVSNNLACVLDQKGIICWGTPPSRHIIKRWRLNKSFSHGTKIFLDRNEVCTLDYNKVRCWKVGGDKKESFSFAATHKIIDFSFFSIGDGSYCMVDGLYNLECFSRIAKISNFARLENFPRKVKKASLQGNYLCTVDLKNHPQCWTKYNRIFNPYGSNPFNDPRLSSESNFSDIDFFTWDFISSDHYAKYGAYGCIKDETSLVCEYKKSNQNGQNYWSIVFKKKGVLNSELFSVGLREKIFSTLIKVSTPLKSKFLISLNKEIEENILSDHSYSVNEKNVFLTLLSPIIFDQNQSAVYRDFILPEFNTLLSEFSNESKFTKKSEVQMRLALAFIKSGVETSMYFLNDSSANALLSLHSYLIEALSSPTNDVLLTTLNEYDKVYSVLLDLKKSSKSKFLFETLEHGINLLTKYIKNKGKK
jgi:hypothetical protein